MAGEDQLVDAPPVARGLEIDHNHPLFLQPSNTPGSSLVSIQLTGQENYAIWSRSIRLGLLGKSKLGFVDGKHLREFFPLSLHDLWEKCNAIVLSWIINSIRKDVLSSVIYASNVSKVWIDMKERFDKVDGSRIHFLHKEIHTMSQGTSTVSSYYSRLRERWDEFDAIMPCPGCNYPESRTYVHHFEYQRLLQFLTGPNDSYAQSRSQILMMTPTPSINQAYSMLISEEGQRSLGKVIQPADMSEGVAFYSNKGNHKPGSSSGNASYKHGTSYSGGMSTGSDSNFKSKKSNQHLYCDYCHHTGHTSGNCYRLHGYPANFKHNFKKKFSNNSEGEGAANYAAGEYGSQWNMNSSFDPGSYVGSSINVSRGQQNPGILTSYGTHANVPTFTPEQYHQILHMLDQGNDGNGTALSVSMSSYNTSHAGVVNWIVDTWATHHMVHSPRILSDVKHISNPNSGNVFLPTGGVT
ncbi:hypothetical protein KY289_031424 [Solanum tuberosum]|nr:hypothetical protein KY289_031424 [Solanum tuberosum]